MTLFDSRTAARMIALAGATLLIAASAALSTLYAWQVGTAAGTAVAVALSVAALGGELLKPFAVAAAADSARAGSWWHAAAAVALAAAAVAFSFSSELGLAATARGDLAAGRLADAEAARAVHERRDRANAEIRATLSARSAAELQPQIDTLAATPGANGCATPPDGPVSRKVCAEVAALRAEAARAQRRGELEAIIADANDRLAASGGRAAGDPLAAALATYADAAGRPVTPEAIAPWLVLPLVVLLEIGSAFGVLVARTVGASAGAPAPLGPAEARAGDAGLRSDTTSPAEPAAATPAATDPPANIDALHLPSAPGESRSAGPADAVAAAVARLLVSRGGTVRAPQRALAAAVGFSVSRVNGALHRMAEAGQIHLDIGKTGTLIALPNSAP